ncbi:type 4a pilus biogenesis protein PilO [Desulfurobacterium sp.]
MAFEGFLDDFKERWSEIPKWQKWIAYIVILIIILYVYKMNVIDPLNMKIEQLNRQISQKRVQVARLLAVEKRRNELKKEIVNLKSRIAALEAKLPTGREEVSGIIKSIAKNTGNTEIGLIRRGKEQSKEYYNQIDYTVVMKTRFPNFISWCKSLVKANRIMTFGDMSMVGLAPEKKKMTVEKIVNGKRQKKEKEYYSYKYTVQVNLNLNAYTLKR